jgi:molybdopterin/thiamine biosynthesis adenylyltransferase
MKLRIAETAWDALKAQLLAREDVETAGILLGRHVGTGAGEAVAVEHSFALPDEAYRVRQPDQISIDPVEFNRLTRPARDHGLSIFTIHTHPGAREAWFSAADDAGDSRLMPSLSCQVPRVPHGSLVLASSGAVAARSFTPTGQVRDVDLQVVGRTAMSSAVRPIRAESWHARQELALGTAGQAHLRHLRVAIVGLGGIGSVVAMQLGHLGIGELVLIDGDVVEASNVSRIVGARTADVGKPKVEIASRYASDLGFTRHVECVAQLLSPQHEALFASCDIVVSCVDRMTPRALVNRWAYRHLVPVVDLGVAFRVGGSGRIVADAGRVVVVGPGRPCLACWGHLNPDELRREAQSEEDRARDVVAGYLEGVEEPQPSVMAFNTLVAGAGVIEVMRLATGFAGTDSPPLRMAFSFSEGTVRRNALASTHRCKICRQHYHTGRQGSY